MSQMTGVDRQQTHGSTRLEKAIGECPVVRVTLDGRTVACLVDTGAQVSTLTETSFKEMFGSDTRPEDISPYLKVSGAQGVEVPFIGYVEFDVGIMNQMTEMDGTRCKESGWIPAKPVER